MGKCFWVKEEEEVEDEGKGEDGTFSGDGCGGCAFGEEASNLGEDEIEDGCGGLSSVVVLVGDVLWGDENKGNDETGLRDDGGVNRLEVEEEAGNLDEDGCGGLWSVVLVMAFF